MHGYERSNHDLSRICRTTMAPGTLVPFYVKVGLPNDTWDINLNADVMTHPTIGPLFGKYKLQLDFFKIPVRLFQGQLHMSKSGIGMKMANVRLPQLVLEANRPNRGINLDNQQVNPSSILKYLGISGIGDFSATSNKREFNALSYLSYWSIYKQYYANKQEEEGCVIHNDTQVVQPIIDDIVISGENRNDTGPFTPYISFYTYLFTNYYFINYTYNKQTIYHYTIN